MGGKEYREEEEDIISLDNAQEELEAPQASGPSTSVYYPTKGAEDHGISIIYLLPSPKK